MWRHHALKVNGAVEADLGLVAEGGREEGDELLLAHLARGAGELLVLDRAEAADMAIDLHVVGRIREHEPRLLLAHEPDE